MVCGMNERTFRVRFLWVRPGVAFAPGELRVSDGRVRGIGPARRGRIAPVAIVPGFVNAHAHLQLEALSRPRRQFLPWVRAVMAARRDSTPAGLISAGRAALRRMMRDGVVSVGEIDSSGLSPGILGETEVSGLCYQELVGFDLGRKDASAAVRRRALPGTRFCRAGLSPHAPYSVSPALMKACRDHGRPLAIHVAETPEEVSFLRGGTGPFRDLLEELGKIPGGFRAPGLSPVAWLEQLGMLGPRTSLIHAQHLEPGDAERIASSGSPVVVCPGTIRYFRRCPPPVPEWLELGIPVALGTDSLGSNAGLSMRAEMQEARQMWPTLSPQVILEMATAHGHRALARPGAGGLRRGGAASFVVLPCEGDGPECLEALTSNARAPSQVWLRGRLIS